MLRQSGVDSGICPSKVIPKLHRQCNQRIHVDRHGKNADFNLFLTFYMGLVGSCSPQCHAQAPNHDDVRAESRIEEELPARWGNKQKPQRGNRKQQVARLPQEIA